MKKSDGGSSIFVLWEKASKESLKPIYIVIIANSMQICYCSIGNY
jgi:hypothetical protein